MLMPAQVHDPTALEDEDEEHEVEDEEEHEGGVEAALRKNVDDGELLRVLVRSIVPRAVHLFLSGPLKVGGWPGAMGWGAGDVCWGVLGCR